MWDWPRLPSAAAAPSRQTRVTVTSIISGHWSHHTLSCCHDQGGGVLVSTLSVMLTSNHTSDMTLLCQHNCYIFPWSLAAWYWLLVCLCYGILWISCRLNSIAMIQYNANVIITNWWVFYIPHNWMFTKDRSSTHMIIFWVKNKCCIVKSLLKTLHYI